VQDRPERLAIEPRRTVDLEHARGEEAAVLSLRREATLNRPGFPGGSNS
jgi:hypothetical protein